MTLFLSRQPIFDASEQLVAYDLSYLDSGEDRPDDAERVLAAERVILEACLTQGLDRVAEGRAAFLPVAPSVLVREAVRVVHPQRAVLSLPRGAIADADVVRACLGLARDGYRFSAHAADVARQPALLEFVHIWRLDLDQVSREALGRVTAGLRSRGAHVMAIGVHNRALRDVAFDAGIELFHGYQLTRPEVLPRRDVGIDHLHAFKLMKAIRDTRQGDHEIEQGFKRDVVLSYKLLRLVNSASMGGKDIHTIGHAIRLLGRETLYRWLSLLLVSGQGERGVALEVARLSLTRARFCEQVAAASGIPRAGGSLFMVGLFSMLDTLLLADMSDLVVRLELAPDLAAALTERADFFGEVLALSEAYEGGHWDRVIELGTSIGVDVAALPDLYMEAIQWARAQMSEVEAREQKNAMLRKVSGTAKALAS
ncbi:MAG: HDOD domain-containing protein [Gemmatimonadetes bacterium]|nr:HDOD domain-containing protein [Gemmatimonadota bacterium]